MEQKFYKTNPDCIEAGKPLPEFDLYISTVLPLENKGIRFVHIVGPELLCSIFRFVKLFTTQNYEVFGILYALKPAVKMQK